MALCTVISFVKRKKRLHAVCVEQWPKCWILNLDIHHWNYAKTLTDSLVPVYCSSHVVYHLLFKISMFDFDGCSMNWFNRCSHRNFWRKPSPISCSSNFEVIVVQIESEMYNILKTVFFFFKIQKGYHNFLSNNQRLHWCEIHEINHSLIKTDGWIDIDILEPIFPNKKPNIFDLNTVYFKWRFNGRIRDINGYNWIACWMCANNFVFLLFDSMAILLRFYIRKYVKYETKSTQTRSTDTN